MLATPADNTEAGNTEADAEAEAGGAGCGRRVGKLYLSRGRFLCRHCGQLAYASQRERPWRRATRRANKLWRRLGIQGGGMPVSAYEHLLEAALRAETQATEAGTARLLRLFAQIERRHSRRKPRFTL
jgi:hypothetical protein